MKDREFLGLGVALLILASVAIFTYRSIDAAGVTLGWVEHTNEVLQDMGEVSSAYARASAARRAYVVAGDESQLATLSELDAHLASTVATVRAAMADNPAQVQRLDELARLYTQRMASLDDSIAQRKRDGTAVENAEGLGLTSRIRSAREEIEKDEGRLLAERDAATRRDVATTKFAEVVGTLASFAILLFAFGILRQEVNRRRLSEQFVESIVDNLPDTVFVKEASEFRFERMNQAGLDFFGRPREAFIGKNNFDLFDRAQAESFQASDRMTLQGRVVVDVPEEQVKTKRGMRWVHTKKVPIIIDGKPTHLLGIAQDITESRAAVLALKNAKDAAESANQELEAFSYSVAHDLRAPLRAIDGFSLALEEDYATTLDDAGRALLNRVRIAAQQMGQLIDGLLELARITRGDLTRQKVNLTEMATQSAARLKEMHAEQKVDLKIDDGLAVEGDARLLASVLDNLIGNAWKFTSKSADARIAVGQEKQEGRSVFYVRDNGAGFDQAYAGKLFGAFQRLHSKAEFDGSGIGLAIVQRIVRRHGGRVWAEGKIGQGATFYFTMD